MALQFLKPMFLRNMWMLKAQVDHFSGKQFLISTIVNVVLIISTMVVMSEVTAGSYEMPESYVKQIQRCHKTGD